MRFLFICFVVVPVIEMWLLIEVGGVIGAGSTILLVLLTAVIGSMLLRSQGLSTLLRARQRLESNQLPANEMVEGLVLAVSGALLLTPGFVTDTVGFVGLLPFTRIPLVSWLVKKVQLSGFTAMGREAEGGDAFRGQNRRYERQAEGDAIDGEFWKEPDSDNKENHRIE